MLIKDIFTGELEYMKRYHHCCTSCKGIAEITMNCYSEGNLDLCRECALQLARKLLEDICDVATKGGRHG